jgi:hypothetical protein
LVDGVAEPESVTSLVFYGTVVAFEFGLGVFCDTRFDYWLPGLNGGGEVVSLGPVGRSYKLVKAIQTGVDRRFLNLLKDFWA